MKTLLKTANITLKTFIILGSTVIALGQNALAGAVDDPLLLNLNIDKFEKRSGDSNSYVFESQAWVGFDLNKLLIKTGVERVNGSNESAKIELLYSRAISPYWDLQMGVRHDFDPQPERSWAVIGLQGLSPYNVNIDTALYFSKSGRTQLDIAAEYEQMITQRLALIPEAEFSFYGQSDNATETGAGFAKSEFSLRLAYEIKREFSPYIGVVHEAKHGKTKRMAKQEGESSSDTKVVVGVQAWF